MANRPNPGDRVYFQDYEGKRILNLDVSELDDVEDSLYLMEIARNIIFNEPKKSVRLLSNVTNTRYNKDGIGRMQDFSKSITPYILASAMVGVGNGITRLFFNGLLKLSGREIMALDTVESAKKYLVSKG